MADSRENEIVPSESIEEIKKKLAKLPPEELEQVISQHVAIVQEQVELQSFSGPLPTSEAFAAYDQVLM